MSFVAMLRRNGLLAGACRYHAGWRNRAGVERACNAIQERCRSGKDAKEEKKEARTEHPPRNRLDAQKEAGDVS